MCSGRARVHDNRSGTPCAYHPRPQNVATATERQLRDLRLVGTSPGIHSPMYPYAAPRGPTYRENSRAHHTWDPAIASNRLFSNSGGAARVGSIPIARSTLRLASGPVGIRDRGQHVDPVGKRWERTWIRRRSRVPTYPQVAPLITRTVTRSDLEKILRVIPARRWRSHLAGLGPASHQCQLSGNQPRSTATSSPTRPRLVIGRYEILSRFV